MAFEAIYQTMAQQLGASTLDTYLQNNPYLVNLVDPKTKNTLLHVVLSKLIEKIQAINVEHLSSSPTRSSVKINKGAVNDTAKIATALLCHGANVFRENSQKQTAFDLMEIIPESQNGLNRKFDFFQTGTISEANYIHQFVCFYNARFNTNLKVPEFYGINIFAKGDSKNTQKIDGKWKAVSIADADKLIYAAEGQQFSKQDLMELNGYFKESREITAQRKAYLVGFSGTLQTEIVGIVNDSENSYMSKNRSLLTRMFSAHGMTSSVARLLKTHQRQILFEAIDNAMREKTDIDSMEKYDPALGVIFSERLLTALKRLLEEGSDTRKYIRLSGNCIGFGSKPDGENTDLYLLIQNAIRALEGAPQARLQEQDNNREDSSGEIKGTPPSQNLVLTDLIDTPESLQQALDPLFTFAGIPCGQNRAYNPITS